MSSTSIQPAEWATHRACWLAWPWDRSLWGDQLEPARREWVALCQAIADPDEGGTPRGEALEVLVPDASAEADAAGALGRLAARFHRVPYGDIWMRDIAPIFVRDAHGGVSAACFGFNGWGEKYVLEHDSDVAAGVAEACGLPNRTHRWVLEGGSVEVDGEGTILTTTQCLLNPNRNPTLSRTGLEGLLADALGGRRVLWLGDGLLNDHTDGHIDTIARFVAPGTVVCMHPSGDDDPNEAVLKTIAETLRGMTDVAGRTLRVVTIPSPGRLVDEAGEVMPASYVNFYIGNRTVVVPTYGTPFDEAAVAALVPLFPGRRVVGTSARAILAGGGAFHCITQQEPIALEATP